MSRILIIEDNQDIRRLIRIALEVPERHLAEARTAAEAQVHLKKHEVDVLILGIGLPGSIDGLALARTIRRLRHGSSPLIIIVSGRSDVLTVEIAKSLDIVGFLNKPFKTADLRQLVEAAESQLQQRHAGRGASSEDRSALGGWIGLTARSPDTP